jgi:UDP-3-O-[3-hydroxymyristoyl] glucosamine N-acyltransferase
MSEVSITAGQIAALVQGTLIGSADFLIHGVAGLNEAGPSDLSFLSGEAFLKDALSTRAGILLVPRHFNELTMAQVIVGHPALAMTKVVSEYFLRPYPSMGFSNLAYRGKNVTLGKDVSVWPFVTLDDDVSIGAGTQLHAGVFVGRGTTIGEACLIYANVTIREGLTIGNRVIIYAGSVVGSDGFGYIQEGGRHHKIPQVGTVVIEDDVELGSNVSVDRATFGKTIIRRGTKVDNLVQIAHNVEIGAHNILVGQVGVAGSSKTGHHVVVGGQAGISDHVTIADQVMIAARTVVYRNVPARELIGGVPSMPLRTWLKTMAVFPKLPELREQVRDLDQRIQTLEKAQETSKSSHRGSRAKRRSPPARKPKPNAKRKA